MNARPVLFLLPLTLWTCGFRTGSESFEQLTERFVYETLALSPVSATATGYHRHQGQVLDEQLDDYSPAGMEKTRALYNDFSQRLQGIDKNRLDPEQQADYDLINGQIALSRLELDTIQNFRHNPTVYVEMIGNALNTPFLLEYAAAPERFRHIIARLKLVPKLLDQAKEQLVSAPPIWVQVATSENEGTRALIDKELRAAVPAELKSDYDAAAKTALDALAGFDQFLSTGLKGKEADWRLGKDNYAKKFVLALSTDRQPQEVLKAAERDMEATRQQMLLISEDLIAKYKLKIPAKATANEKVRAVLDKVAESHAKPDQYFAEAEADLTEARQFVQSRNLLALPQRSNLKVIPTPEFMRGLYGVGGFNSAPPLEPNLRAFYWITPLEHGGKPEAIESRLREYNTYGLKLLTIHEAMPGHYVQAEVAADIQPKGRKLLRAIYGSGPYVEGWAVYVTEAMLDAGYLNNSPELRLTFLKQQLRVLANTILDVRLQTMGMTDEQALSLMLDQGFQEKAEAVAKLQRAKLSSCQLPTYYVGYREWRRMRLAYQETVGINFSLRHFHDRALREGALPLDVCSRLITLPKR